MEKSIPPVAITKDRKLPVMNYWWFAVIVMIVLGIAFSLVPSAMWPSVPKIIPMKQLGSAYATIFYIQNIGLTMVPWLIGWVIEHFATLRNEAYYQSD